MFYSQFLLLGIIGCYLMYYLWQRRKYYILSWKIGSSLGLPFLGTSLFVRNPENLLGYIEQQRKSLKNYLGVVWLGPSPMIYVSEPNIIKKILSSSYFYDKLDTYKIGNKHIGDGLITSNSPIWNNHRKLLDPTFKFKILKNHIPTFNEKTDILIKRLTKYADGYEFDVIPIMQLCSLDIACQTTMGKCMNFQLDENSKILGAYCTLLQVVTKRVLNPILHLDVIFSLTNLAKKVSDAQNILEDFVENLIVKKLSNKSDVNKSGEESSNKLEIEKEEIFIDRTIELLRSNHFSWKDAIDNSNIIVAAAFETTANTVSCILMCLAMFPQYQEKLFNEILQVFPKKDEFDVTYEDIVKLSYMDMIINETMRLMSPVPMIGRKSSEEFTLFDGIVLPKGTEILFDIFHMHRDEYIWGSNAKTFYPDHFLPDNFKKIPTFAYMPFSKGGRNCIGGKYAMMATKTILSKILRKYRIETDFQFKDLTYLYNITLKFSKIPLIKIYERAN